MDAGAQLASALGAYRGTRPLVLAIPRGGVPLGRVVADALAGELDVVLVHKLGAPSNPEFAVGAVDETGAVHVAEHARLVGADASFIRREAERQVAVLRRRRQSYRPGRPRSEARGRTVIIVDDGLATGETMRAALVAVRREAPARLVCAVPVAPPQTLEMLREVADDVVCLRSPEDFYAVGQVYEEFAAVEDDEVVDMLASAAPATEISADAPTARSVRIPLGDVVLDGDLVVPAFAQGLVLFAHGSGSSRRSPRNRFVADAIGKGGFATLLFDLLTPAEDENTSTRFDIALLASRLQAALDWTAGEPGLARLPIGLFGASTGAAAALRVAAMRPQRVDAVVSRGGRPDLAGELALTRVAAPVLLIVGGADRDVLQLNRLALAEMPQAGELVVVPGATHLFEEEGALAQVARLATDWFSRWLGTRTSA